MKEIYEIQVFDDDNEWHAIILPQRGNAFETKHEAKSVEREYKRKFPYVIRTRVIEIT